MRIIYEYVILVNALLYKTIAAIIYKKQIYNNIQELILYTVAVCMYRWMVKMLFYCGYTLRFLTKLYVKKKKNIWHL